MSYMIIGVIGIVRMGIYYAVRNDCAFLNGFQTAAENRGQYERDYDQ